MPTSEPRPDPAVVPCPLQASPGQVEVVVVDDLERPLPGVAVELCRLTGDEALRMRTDAHGVVLFDGLDEGGYRLRLLDVEPALWRVLGQLPLPERPAGQKPHWGPASQARTSGWTCEGTESLTVLAARLGVRPSRLVEAGSGAALDANVAPAPGTRVSIRPFSPAWVEVRRLPAGRAPHRHSPAAGAGAARRRAPAPCAPAVSVEGVAG
ncbi:hypothetical protein ACLESD_53430, partial [Pyxidicoccus sp. 3LFB2]